MQKFCHFLLFSALIPFASLAPTTLKSREPDLETIIAQTLELSRNITTDPGKDRKGKIVSEEFNRQEPKCIQTHIKTFSDGLHVRDQAIKKNLQEIAARFNDSSCPSLDETSCSFHITDREEFKTQLIQFLEEIPSDCQNLKPSSSARS
ncbi:granulocyte-macrophage colony-stimulating factor [Petaurus breviceps papuanus]|uniref:granulocyte-macrophage colony-stimulating factor n=1 Tax=Petaurus breviceps papuanus TaxID=3040969 RepID=UPI0036DC037A